MFRSLTLTASLRPGNRMVILAAFLLGFALTACSSDPPPDMNTVQKLINEDRQFEALKLLIPMAQGGNPQAQYELAGFYHYGYVGANDYAKALKWYRASARQGYADAMVGLSVMYLGGQGVAKDRREAFVWLNLAAQYMTDKKALAKLKGVRDEIGRTLTKDDIAFAKAESVLLQPESSSVQPNEAESIDHLPDTLPVEPPAAVSSEPLQNVPPDTAPLSSAPLSTVPATPPALPQVELQPALPAAPRPAPAASLPTTTPTTVNPPTSSLPMTTLPATTAPATPLPIQTPPSTTTTAPAPTQTQPVDPIPQF